MYSSIGILTTDKSEYFPSLNSSVAGSFIQIFVEISELTFERSELSVRISASLLVIYS
jgi:hypothetical protein